MNVAVIGAGSWGTALAQVAARNGHAVWLWSRRAEVADAINGSHKNPDYLKDVQLSASIVASSSLAGVVDGVDAVVVVVPSKFLRLTADLLRANGLPETMPIVICTKGVEGETGMVPVQVFDDVLGAPGRLAALSGPNHAEEVVLGVPAATVVASPLPATASYFQELLGSEAFRIYTSDDVLGVELCAAYKNIIAIAVGASYGLGYGDNTAAMLMTRGQAEMSRLVEAVGGSPLTCMGLAGTGDLIATCMSRHSRNRAFGEALAEGMTVEQYEAAHHMVAEGAQACRTIATLSKRFGVELPIADVVRGVVWEGVDPRSVAETLLSRTPKPEFY